ncbi:MAG: fumarylacetoacetate hydrolase family protein [Kofleriaceae bacterium]|nr:fumarylacetoacetate hydrolase family protein [Myxococcales bacterium]MCB9561228.1 fumarylacetoacetate hydrolase family protein [Kofleriaceae bacterium]MCB9573808.1 fumarylacetoacetate hydrolase family protein [Kofleriaceae bacterium]
MTTVDAYHVSRRLLGRRLADGERVVGKKIGVTSVAVQTMLDVHTPDFGWLTDRMQHDGAAVPIGAELIQPRAEAELAFGLARELRGPGVTAADVVAATAWVAPCFEIVDSRIAAWKIRYQDTVADNASSGLFVIGADRVAPGAVDFATCEVEVTKNGAPLSRGTGAEAMGSPLACVAWLANQLAAFDLALEAGELILSGSLVPLEPVVPGDVMTAHVPGVGSVTARFT